MTRVIKRKNTKSYTSEWVSLGHPDKVADYISCFILDELIRLDPSVRYALEVQIKDNFITLSGEVSTVAPVGDEFFKESAVRAVVDIGYTADYADKWNAVSENVIDPRKIQVECHISKQSSDIAKGVDNDAWGDQGIFFGCYDKSKDWCNGFRLDYYYAREIGRRLFASGLGGLDIKTQVALFPDDNTAEVVVAIPLLKECQDPQEYEWRFDSVIGIVKCCFPEEVSVSVVVNGTGAYEKHSSIGDCGTTGRKLVCDFYGGACRVGGGSPWTKDGTKADLALNLFCRNVARSVSMDCGTHVDVEASCCIGGDKVLVNIDNGGSVESFEYVVKPSELIKLYRLDKPVYCEMCRLGLFYYVDAFCPEV